MQGGRKGFNMQAKWWFTVTVYVYLTWERESKTLTYQMKREMKGRDGISPIENHGEEACWAGKSKGANLQSENIGKQLKPCTGVNV